MSIQTFRAFLIGPTPWRPRSPWHPILAVLATIGIVVAGQIVPAVVLGMLSGGPVQTQPGDPGAPDAMFEMIEGVGASVLILGQVSLAVLTLAAAGLFGARSVDVLSLERPEGGGRSYAFALLVMLPVIAVINAAAFALSPSGFKADFDQFAKLAHIAEPLAAFLAIAVGAPLWEEMLFRGFLLGPLVGPLGFWPAAVLVSGTWTALHIGYSIAGLSEVFLIGIYFSWLLRRTGSLWVPIACHGLYNAALFAIIRYWPL
ncbi:MAG: lysostaphin resistance A-like protein [Hyphomicrobiaceae bacterium]